MLRTKIERKYYTHLFPDFRVLNLFSNFTFKYYKIL